MKTYQISEDRLVDVKKNLVSIKQKDSEKSFEFTPSRLVLRTFVTKYCTSLVCVEQREFATFHISFFLISPLTSYVRLSRRWACFCQSLTEINIAVQQLDELDREVKLFSHGGGGHYVSFRCVDFRKWFQPRDQKDPIPTRKGIALNLDQWVRMTLIVEAINNDHPVLAAALPCYMQDGHLGTFECRECYPFLKLA